MPQLSSIRASRKYWFTAVSSPVRTSLRISMTSSWPRMRPTLRRAVAQAQRAGDDQLLQHRPAAAAVGPGPARLAHGVDVTGTGGDHIVELRLRDGLAEADVHQALRTTSRAPRSASDAATARGTS